MARAAREWMARHRAHGDSFRFDVVGVVYRPGGPEIIHVENAFTVR
jgi:Holliday junction resolvase-like predicted endonuclease